jgi:hypothetical protein
MSHTIYAAKFEQTITHHHVHLRRESQSHAPVHVLMRLYPIDKSLVCLQAKEGRHVRICFSSLKQQYTARPVLTLSP